MVAFVLLAATASAHASEAPDPLFRDLEILAMTITAPLTTLVKERPKEDYLPGEFQFAG